MTKVVHLTSVHSAYDTRIFHKECKTLAAAGHEVVLVAPHEREEVVDGMRIRPVRPPRDRWQRIINVVPRVYRAALQEDADIYHFHDPELIPVGWTLKRRGNPVIYDVHEDYQTSIRQKRYLPPWSRALVSAIWSKFELVSTRSFALVLAEKYYRQRFPNGTVVLNYPSLQMLPDPPDEEPSPPRLLYTGTLSEDRGALLHARLVTLAPTVEVHVVGRCSDRLKEQMIAAAGREADRLRLDVSEAGVPYITIASCYAQRWLAGLALFPPTPHHKQKELTKFFEYMGAGIPILCSDFPVWRDLVAGTGCGLCVDPQDPTAIAEAISWLRGHPAEARAMGQRGRQAVLDRYNWGSQARKLLALYDALLKDCGLRG